MNKIPPIPKISIAKIREIADAFRQEHFDGSIPVDIMAAIEFDLGLEVRPVAGLKSACGIDALIMSDMDVIYVDQMQLMDERYDSRLRFSLAHELGHRVLHADFYDALGIKTLEDAYQFIDEIPDESYTVLEWHAHEFAGRLLVPPDLLTSEARSLIEPHVHKLLSLGIERNAILEQSSTRLARIFGVSEDAMNRRLTKEEIINHINWD